MTTVDAMSFLVIVAFAAVAALVVEEATAIA
jgi:hypothetical protein